MILRPLLLLLALVLTFALYFSLRCLSDWLLRISDLWLETG